MRTIIITLSILFFSLGSFAQERGPMGKDGFFIRGEMEIFKKNKEVIKGNFDIDNTKIKDSDINYQDIDYILHDNGRYEYVCVGKNKIQLLKVNTEIGYGIKAGIIAEGRRVVFYESIPKWQPKVDPNVGVHSVTTVVKYFMLKEGMEQAVKYDSWKVADLVKKYLADCPKLMEMIKDKSQREKLTAFEVYDIYNNSCTE